MKRITGSLSFIFSFISIINNAQTMSVAEAQKIIDSLQNLPRAGYKIIEEKSLKLSNGDVITTAVSFYDTLDGQPLVDYNFFIRKYGLTIKEGKKLNPVYDNIVFWENDQYMLKIVRHYEGYLVLINKNFKALKVYGRDATSDGKYFSLTKGGNWGVVDDRLNVVIPFEYETLSSISYFEEYEILVQEQRFRTYAAKFNGTWGLISSANEEIIPFEYQYLSNASNGRVTAKKNSKWGIIELDQSSIIPLSYDSIVSNNSHYYILKGKKWGVWNVDLNFENVKFDFDGFALSPSSAQDMGKVGSKWCLINFKPIDSSTPFYDDYYFDKDAGPFIGLKVGKNWGIYNCEKSKLVTDMVYSKIIDVLYERGQKYIDGRLAVDYPVWHFKVIKSDGKIEDLLLKD